MYAFAYILREPTIIWLSKQYNVVYILIALDKNNLNMYLKYIKPNDLKIKNLIKY